MVLWVLGGFGGLWSAGMALAMGLARSAARGDGNYEVQAEYAPARPANLDVVTEQLDGGGARAVARLRPRSKRVQDHDAMLDLLADYGSVSMPARLGQAIAAGVLDRGQAFEPDSPERVELDRLAQRAESVVLDALVHCARSSGWDGQRR